MTKEPTAEGRVIQPTWMEHAYRAIVNLAAANIAQNDREILVCLDRAKDNIDWAMAAVKEAKKEQPNAGN